MKLYKKSIFGYDVSLTMILSIALLVAVALIIWALKGNLLTNINRLFDWA